MLSRIAQGLYTMGRSVERVQNVTRILEVNHKMSLERAREREDDVWEAIAQSFLCPVERYTERALYDVLVLSETHPHSVRRCLREARDDARSMRDHISDEMWIHLNRHFLEFRDVGFEDIVSMGRSEFNRRIEILCDALHGLADDTMIRGEAWAFLRLGKQIERALMICRILDIKRKSISPAEDGAPADVHHWQALLRSLSGYAPYRRAYDARIQPERVLEFVLQREAFPRSLAHALAESKAMLGVLASQGPFVVHLERLIDGLLDRIRLLDIERTIRVEVFGRELAYLNEAMLEIADAIELAYFTSLRPTSVPITVAPGASLTPQQQQQQQHSVMPLDDAAARRGGMKPWDAKGKALLMVSHVTRLTYSDSVVEAHSEVRKSPVDTGLQRVVTHRVEVSPAASVRSYRDYFGSDVRYFNLLEPHEGVEIRASSIVETTDAICCGPSYDLDERPWTEKLAEFLQWSSFVPYLDEYREVPNPVESGLPGDEFVESLRTLGGTFRSMFRYDPDATDVQSSPEELFVKGGGVCQDLTHAMLGVLRLAAVPCRYVSGYIFDPGSAGGHEGEAIRGAAASHAWVQAWHPELGWIGVDPTNDKLVDWQYVRVATGRDYADVQPLRGVFLGTARQTLEVEVDVQRIG